MPFELDSPNDEFPLVVWRTKKMGKEGTVWKTSAENRASKGWCWCTDCAVERDLPVVQITLPYLKMQI